jgi:hypothetical protein
LGFFFLRWKKLNYVFVLMEMIQQRMMTGQAENEGSSSGRKAQGESPNKWGRGVILTERRRR